MEVYCIVILKRVTAHVNAENVETCIHHVYTCSYKSSHHVLALPQRESVGNKASCLHPLHHAADVGWSLRALRCVVRVTQENVNVSTRGST